MTPQSPVFGARINDEAAEVLEALKYVEDIKTNQELLQPVIENYAAEVAKRPDVKAVMRHRKAPARDAKLVSLGDRRRRRQRS